MHWSVAKVSFCFLFSFRLFFRIAGCLASCAGCFVLIFPFFSSHLVGSAWRGCSTSCNLWLVHFFVNEKKVHLRHFRSARVWNSFDLLDSLMSLCARAFACTWSGHILSLRSRNYTKISFHFSYSAIFSPVKMIKFGDMNGSLAKIRPTRNGKIVSDDAENRNLPVLWNVTNGRTQ